MKLEKFDVLSSYALATTVTLFVALICGCDRREEVYPSEGFAYTKDPAYMAQLDAQVKKRNAIFKQRAALNREYEALLKEHHGDFTALTNTARGAKVAAEILENERLIASNRMESATIMRERILRAQKDSERIRKGEAKAIDISKKEEK